VYDDIVFDSSAIKEIHPKLHEVSVHRLSDFVFTIDSIEVDGEYFLTGNSTHFGLQENEEEEEDSPADKQKPRGPGNAVASWLNKAE